MSRILIDTTLEGIQIVFGDRKVVGTSPIQINNRTVEAENLVVFKRRENVQEDPTYGTNWPYDLSNGITLG